MLASLEQFLQKLSRATQVDAAAVADNCRFDERANTQRWQAFANALPHNNHASLDFSDWGEADRLHFEKRVKVISGSTPDAFLDINQPAWLEGLAPEQVLVRLETLDWLLASVWNTDFIAFQSLLEAPARQVDAQHTLNKYFDDWNSKRDNRPAFAAFLDEVQAETDSADWPHQLRDRLGLGHYSPEHGTKIPVALMRYSLQEALNAKASKGLPTACALPTVLDGGMHPYFYPVPSQHAYGATLHLADDKSDQLAAEILHCRVDYQRQHVWKLGWIERPHVFHEMANNRDSRLRGARDLHLLALRIASDREDFGEDLVGRA